MSFADRLQRAWYQGHPALCVLAPLELLYRRVVEAKRRRFLKGESAAYRAPVPVIVVYAIPTPALAFCKVEPAVLTTFKTPP